MVNCGKQSRKIRLKGQKTEQNKVLRFLAKNENFIFIYIPVFIFCWSIEIKSCFLTTCLYLTLLTIYIYNSKRVFK